MLYLTGKPILLAWRIRHPGSWRDNLSFLSFYSPTHIGWYSSGRVVEYGRVGCVDELILTFKQHKIIEQYQFLFFFYKKCRITQIFTASTAEILFYPWLESLLTQDNKRNKGPRDSCWQRSCWALHYLNSRINFKF